jgi:hypothetical protein
VRLHTHVQCTYGRGGGTRPPAARRNSSGTSATPSSIPESFSGGSSMCSTSRDAQNAMRPSIYGGSGAPPRQRWGRWEEEAGRRHGRCGGKGRNAAREEHMHFPTCMHLVRTAHAAERACRWFPTCHRLSHCLPPSPVTAPVATHTSRECVRRHHRLSRMPSRMPWLPHTYTGCGRARLPRLCKAAAGRGTNRILWINAPV